MLEILHKHNPFERIRGPDNCDVRGFFLWRFFTWPRNYYNDNNILTMIDWAYITFNHFLKVFWKYFEIFRKHELHLICLELTWLTLKTHFITCAFLKFLLMLDVTFWILCQSKSSKVWISNVSTTYCEFYLFNQTICFSLTDTKARYVTSSVTVLTDFAFKLIWIHTLLLLTPPVDRRGTKLLWASHSKGTGEGKIRRTWQKEKKECHNIE